MKPLNDLLDWLDSRTGWRTGRAHLLEEPIPAGVGWWFVTGSILLMLLSVQLITGVVLAMYYVPSPEHAYDSIRYIMERVTFGRVLRGLHFFGASFIVVAAVIHMLRVVALGSYKKPREVTWITGVVLLLVILGFALSGYLLPWDQKAYWATTVTINIARSGPMGEYVAGLMRGGDALGSLTLLRWYAAHVFLLPASLIVFVVAHLFLMRRHGISGALKPVPGEPKPFYPYHALKDTIAGAARVRAAGDVRDRVHDAARPDCRSDRRELRAAARVVFPQPVPAAEVLPRSARAAGDDGDSRTGRRHCCCCCRSSIAGPTAISSSGPLVTCGFAVIGGAIIVLTYLGYKDTPAHAESGGLGSVADRRPRVRAGSALPDLSRRRWRRQSDSRSCVCAAIPNG